MITKHTNIKIASSLLLLCFLSSVKTKCEALRINTPNIYHRKPLLLRHPQFFCNEDNYHSHFRHNRENKSLSMTAASSDSIDSKLSLEYRVASTTFNLLGLSMVGLSLKMNPGGANLKTLLTTLYLASGPFAAGSISSILPSAVENNRLKSDTYQRLNLFLVFYSVIQLLAMVVNYTRFLNIFAALGVVPILGLIPAFKGWNQGIASANDNSGKLKALLDAGMDVLKGMTNFKTAKGFGYLIATYFLMFLKIQKLLDIKNVLVSGGEEVAGMISARLFRYAKFSLLFGTLSTLKSAADRDRLEGGTFIKLNYISSFFFFTLALYRTTPLPEVIIASLFSLFCGYNGISSVLKKNKK